MSAVRLILASLLYHWRANLAVALGVAAGSAVLTGALLVGDSMRGSLRDLTLGRLGRIDEVLLAEQFFREQLADELAARPEFREHFDAAVPAIILRASLQGADPKAPRQANRVTLVGCDARFWRLWPGGDRDLAPRQIVLSRPLADRLGVVRTDMDDVILHLPERGNIPGDSPLGRKTDTVRRLRLSVAAIIPSEGPGRFSLRPSQQTPLVAYMALDELQRRLDRSDRINAIAVAGRQAADAPPGREALREGHELLGRLLDPAPADYGIRIEQIAPDRPTDADGRHGYINVTTDRLVLSPALEAAIRRTLRRRRARFQPVLTYLANTIDTQQHDAPVERQDDDGRIIPYSTIAAVDFATAPPLGPFLTPEGNPIAPSGRREDDAIVLNSWAAEDLGVEPGATVYVSYFLPESTHGRAEQRTHAFRLAAIVELAGAADDPDFTPIVPGLTDEDSIDNWEAPFSPFHGDLIRGKDDDYFQQHGLTPKAFVSLDTGQRLWGSRFGGTTSFRVDPGDGTTVEGLTEALRHEFDPAALGLAFQPVKLQGLEASAGATPFSVLFLGLSFFVIAAAVMLVALLFRLGIDRRAAQLGILAAVGFPRRRIAMLLAAEGLLVAVVGGLLGVPLGVGYAALMLLGLRTWWVAAVVTPFLQLHVGLPGQVVPWSLVIGLTSGVAVALAVILWGVWRARQVAVVRLLAGRTTDAAAWIPGHSRIAGRLALGMVLAAVVLGLLAARLPEEAQAGAFFGTGAVVLVAALMMVLVRLRHGRTGAAIAAGGGNLLRMALRSAARNPGRSTLTVGLVATACFLIVAISAFRLDPHSQTPTLASGNGGFALVAESDQPIYHSLDTDAGRRELGFSDKDIGLLAETTTVGLRLSAGDDASCLNLYRPQQPRVLGMPKTLIDRGGFTFASSAAVSAEEQENPWLLLEADLGNDTDGVPLVPVILEKNTATYALHLSGGVGQTYEIVDDRGQTVRLKIVGLLANSILQGDLLVAEAAFLRHFPDSDGYRFFLVETPPGLAAEVRNTLETTLGDYGMAAEGTGERLGRFLAVQNTYLSTFQNLGGLGLLLGTFGLATVQLRNVLERRGELALLRAAGFRRRRLAEMVLLENALLLLAGLGCGVLAAMVAVLPHLVFGRASIPFGSLAGTLAVVLVAGLASGLAAVRAALRAPLLAALRED